MRDCSSMYCSESVLLLSSSERRLCTVLKKDSCVVGFAEAAAAGGDGAPVFVPLALSAELPPLLLPEACS